MIILSCLAFAKITFADAFTGFWFLGILASMLWRLLLERQDVPPPGIPIVFLGVLCGAIAAFALALNSAIGFDFLWLKFWRLLYFQGLLWLPVTGVAPYLLPRFFNLPSRHSFEESATLPPKWIGQFLLTSLASLLLLASFAIEIWLSAPGGLVMRAVVVMLYLSLTVPGLVSLTKTNGLAFSLRWIMPSAACGWLLAAAYPHLRIGLSHFMFISGLGMLMLAVSTRVILGHNDRHDRLASPLKWYHAIWALLLLTASTRLSADFIPKVRTSHLIYAAVLWVGIVIFWAWKIRKESRIPRTDNEERKSCPRRKRGTKAHAQSD